MTENVKNIFEQQKSNRWRIAKTSTKERLFKINKVKEAVLSRREELHQALFDDFKKNPGEVDLTEVHPTIAEINDVQKHLSRWMKPHRVKTPLTLLGTRSEIRYEPKGVVLILSPWNYPFQLLMSPLIAAIAAGNCVIAKPSSKVPHTAHFLKKLISDLFSENEVALIEGDASVADSLLELPFDHIFFTGSPFVGKKVMAQASKNLTPVTLELGGKSPVIIDESANLKEAAERIAWGKFVNAGQTCVAPDYLLIHENNKKEFVAELKKVVGKRYGATEEARQKSPDFCRLVGPGHLKGLQSVLNESVNAGAVIELGGNSSEEGCYLAPTLLTNVQKDSPIMKEEIFGPILPVLTYKNLEEAIELIQGKEKPLALYIFSKNKDSIEDILKNTTAGGTCINNLVIHLANSNLPFGGVGNSGMGNYHGFFGFKTFSHERAVLKQGKIDLLKFFYPPYTKRVRKMIQLGTKYLG